jgi:hypothetical protein
MDENPYKSPLAPNEPSAANAGPDFHLTVWEQIAVATFYVALLAGFVLQFISPK